MNVIFLKFSDNKSEAPKFMDAHNAWIAKGFEDGVFHCVGSLDVGGGCILADGDNDAALQERINADPFVEHNVVTAEIHHVDLKRTTPELSHLMSKN